MQQVEIREGTIRLGQLLKLAGLAEHGAEAKSLLDEGEVQVNDTVETRRGRQIAAGDSVVVGDEVIRVVSD
ncbi:ribosome-associated protein [Halopolyspora algeriensis]|uniref:Ribosome-associated protein n=1 Tax=Halopolyspora algeriensis TaxID=1500506 RepID=A0A368VQE5_9ACTN|nr:RNA-binding S4 domain-containing protein [Halopolyspora algeriensis]RCW44069.1 ribosome-associated protein [Halopolyspora algeriensis]TQM53432.1 ribosome-associated protein [Halopolyspora algeriensis]